MYYLIGTTTFAFAIAICFVLKTLASQVRHLPATPVNHVPATPWLCTLNPRDHVPATPMIMYLQPP